VNVDALVAKYLKKLIWLSKHHKDDWCYFDPSSELKTSRLEESIKIQNDYEAIVRSLVEMDDKAREADFYLRVAKNHPSPGVGYIQVLKVIALSIYLPKRLGIKLTNDALKILVNIQSSSDKTKIDDFNFHWKPVEKNVSFLIKSFSSEEFDNERTNRGPKKREHLLSMLGQLIKNQQQETRKYRTIKKCVDGLSLQKVISEYIDDFVHDRFSKLVLVSARQQFPGRVEAAEDQDLLKELLKFVDQTSNVITFNFLRYVDGEIYGIPRICLIATSDFVDDIVHYVTLPPLFVDEFLNQSGLKRKKLEESLNSYRFNVVNVPRMSKQNANFEDLFQVVWRQTYALMLDAFEATSSTDLGQFFSKFDTYDSLSFFVYLLTHRFHTAVKSIYLSATNSTIDRYLFFGDKFEDSEIIYLGAFTNAMSEFAISDFAAPLEILFYNNYNW